MIPLENPSTPRRGLVIAAFAAIYLIWGSTYLVIRYAIETIPPFLMFGSRALLAGIILHAWSRRRGCPSPTRAQWRDAVYAGGLLLFAGSAWIAWCEHEIPSSIAALIVAALPMWMILFNWKAAPPTPLTMTGLALGFAGVSILILDGRGYDNQPLSLPHVALCVAATLCWAFGSIFSRRADKPASPFMAVAIQMIAGGGISIIAGLLMGEAANFDISMISLRSLLSWGYLLVFGSLIAYTAYVWLLDVSTPARVSTYAFVNPLIAVMLGCTVGAEPFSIRLLSASMLIVIAVAAIIGTRGKPKAVSLPLAPSPVTEEG
jgi:drug/metabolite transporter (DMT)-like permease